MTIPTWLQRHLETRGLWDADGVTRHARVRRCRNCRAWIVVGLDADLMALEANCDTDPLSTLGEAAALIVGRATFALRWRENHLILDFRTHYDITGHPAGTPYTPGGTPAYDVVASHHCGTRFPTMTSVHLAPKATDTSGPPPY